ncbi:MAG: fimbrillin family protein [Bacteroidales bacterium]|nr:fimbrillin family protein [Bacteroidales bacterium]
MKKILLVAASVTLLAAGCQKTEIVNPVGEPALSFTTGMNKLTKAVGTADADSTGMNNLQAQDFRVWAYGDFEDENTLNTKELDEIYDGMANLNVYYTKTTTEQGVGSSESWAPSKEYYWPGVDKNLRFFAVSGADCGDDLSTTANVTIDITRTPGEEGASDTVVSTLTVKNFAVDSLAPNKDLMVADFVCQNQSKKEVELNFRHALSKVQFLFKTIDGSDRDVFVQSLEVAGINTVSTLTVTPDTEENAAKPISFAWAPAAEPKTFADDYVTVPEDFPTNVEYMQGATEDNTAMKLTPAAETFATWLVVPQNIEGYQVKVLYVIGERQFESIFTLSSENLTSWEPNQYVRYTVTLAPNLISFVPKVEDWDNPTDVGYQN